MPCQDTSCYMSSFRVPMFLFSNISFVVKQQNLRGIELSNGNRFPLIIPLTNLEQWPVPSDVDSRHNPDGAHLSEATSLYFYVHLYLYFSVFLSALLCTHLINEFVQQG